MERQANKKEKKSKHQKPLWIKISPGTLIRKLPIQLRIKSKQEVRATVEELGTNLKTGELFCDTDFKLIEDGTGKYAVKKSKKKIEKETVLDSGEELYEVKSVGSGWYNLISPSGEIVNEKKLRAAEAEELKTQLESEKNE